MTLLLEHFDTLLATPADVEQLNRAILTLAVQGRLVAQDPGDEPVKKSLQKNFAGKFVLANDDEKPFELPENWEWVQLDVICDKLQDGTHYSPKNQYPTHEEGTYLYITSKNIKEDGVNLSNVTYIDDEIHRQIYQRCNPEKGDVLLIKDGAMTGVVTINNLEEEFTLLSSVALIKTKKLFLLPSYLMYYLRSPVGLEGITGKMSGSAIRRIVMNKLEKTLIALPPLAEQKRIVARVEALFAQTRALAEKLSRAGSDLEALNQSALFHLLAADSPEEFDRQWGFIAAHFESLFTRPEHIAPLRQSILELAVRGKLTRRAAGDESARALLRRIRKEKEARGKKEVFAPVKESEKPFPLPDGWECIRLAEIADIGTGVAKGKKYNPDEKVISLPYLRVANVQRGYLDLEEMKEIEIREDEYERYALQSGDLLLTEGGDADKLGRSAIWRGEIENCIHQNHIFRARPYSELKSEWLMLYTNSPLGRNYFLGASKQTTNLASINKTQLSNCPVPIPPLAEQARIVAKVESLLGLCDALESRLRAAQEERARLVQSVLAL